MGVTSTKWSEHYQKEAEFAKTRRGFTKKKRSFQNREGLYKKESKISKTGRDITKKRWSFQKWVWL